MRITRTRLRTVALAAITSVLAVGLVPITPAAATPRATTGLFGSADPTYDGAFRQSLALLGLSASRTALPAAAVAWLAGQQCASGAFQAFRADPAVPCAAPDPASFSGPDSNSTALAAMALRVAGRKGEAARAVSALVSAQNGDGGWGYTLGSPSDVNSTGLALAALHGAPSTAAMRTSAGRATRFLTTAQVPCTASGQFGLPYQPGKAADVLASAQGLAGLAGTLPVTAGRATGARVTCSSPAPARIASFLGSVVRRTDGAIPSVLDSTQTDWNAAAVSALALVAAGGEQRAVSVAMAALRSNVAAYVGSGSAAKPAALGTLIQAAVATGASPRSFAGANLVTALLATLQK